MSRPRHTTEALEAIFLATWQATDHDLTACVEAVRDALLGASPTKRKRPDRPTPVLAQVEEWEEIQQRAWPVVVAVARRHEMLPQALFGRERTIRMWHARSETMWLLREMGMTHPEVAIALKRRDHTSSLHACQAVEARIAERPALRGELHALMGREAAGRRAA